MKIFGSLSLFLVCLAAFAVDAWEETMLPHESLVVYVDSDDAWYAVRQYPGTISVSKNHGQTWKTLDVGDGSDEKYPNTYHRIYQSSKKTLFLMATSDQRQVLYKLKKGEQASEVLVMRDRMDVYFTPNQILAYSDPYTLLRSKDDGESWDVIWMAKKKLLSRTLSFAFSAPTNTIFVATPDGVLKLGPADKAFTPLTDSPKDMDRVMNLSDKVLLCSDTTGKFYTYSLAAKKWADYKFVSDTRLWSSSVQDHNHIIGYLYEPNAPLKLAIFQAPDGEIKRSTSSHPPNVSFWGATMAPSGEILFYRNTSVFRYAVGAVLNIKVTGSGAIRTYEPISGELFLTDDSDVLRDTCSVGKEIQLTALPDKGFRFVRWEGDVGDKKGEKLTVKITKPSFNITAVFEKIP